MATWKLSNYHKKNAVERQFWRKDDRVIIREEGFRWGTWYCESDTKPDVDLKNPDGYEVNFTDYDWELDSMDDGCWGEIEAGRNTTEEDIADFETAWDNDGYDGVEALGWYNDDTEFILYGPLQLENEDTGETWNGDSLVEEESPLLSDAEIDEMMIALDFPEEKPLLTDWFPVSVNPVREGTYQVLDTELEQSWPFESNVKPGVWDGKTWDNANIVKWRGLTEDPNQ